VTRLSIVPCFVSFPLTTPEDHAGADMSIPPTGFFSTLLESAMVADRAGRDRTGNTSDHRVHDAKVACSNHAPATDFLGHPQVQGPRHSVADSLGVHEERSQRGAQHVAGLR
jgi:hypothetical protein